jgi:O-antigen/teichoic acid export membrane protein
MLKQGLLLLTANISAALLRMVRNILIARLISVENFGIASTLAIAMTLIETLSYIGLDRLIIQARDGEEPNLLATLNAIQAVRGAFGAAVLFFSAGPIALIFGIPEVSWAFRAMAFIPLLNGLDHLGIVRLQREMRFLPYIQTELTSLLISTVAAILLAFEFGDYRAMLYALLVQQLVFTLTSHAVATSPYRWAWDQDIVRRAFGYGWPLLLASLAAFAAMYGDRIIVGSLLGMTKLGWFSAGTSLAMAASLVIARTHMSFFMPLLSQAQDRPQEFRRVYLAAVQYAIMAGVFLAVAFAIAGPAVLNILYGAKYAPAAAILIWIAVAQAFRTGSVATAATAMSKAYTGLTLVSNIVRLLVLPIAWFLALNGADLQTVVAVGVVGEALSFASSVYLLRRRFQLSLSGLGVPCALSLGTLTLACASFYFPAFVPVPRGYSYSISGSLLVALLLTIWSMPVVRRFNKLLFRTERSGAMSEEWRHDNWTKD